MSMPPFGDGIQRCWNFRKTDSRPWAKCKQAGRGSRATRQLQPEDGGIMLPPLAQLTRLARLTLAGRELGEGVSEECLRNAAHGSLVVAGGVHVCLASAASRPPLGRVVTASPSQQPLALPWTSCSAEPGRPACLREEEKKKSVTLVALSPWGFLRTSRVTLELKMAAKIHTSSADNVMK